MCPSDPSAYDTLVGYDETANQIVPSMATSWTVVDETTIEFKLRSGMKFTNGEAADANAVKFTVDRTLNPATKSLRNTVLVNVNSVDVVDPLTARFNLKQPDPLLIQYIIAYAESCLRTSPPRTPPCSPRTRSAADRTR